MVENSIGNSKPPHQKTCPIGQVFYYNIYHYNNVTPTGFEPVFLGWKPSVLTGLDDRAATSDKTNKSASLGANKLYHFLKLKQNSAKLKQVGSNPKVCWLSGRRRRTQNAVRVSTLQKFESSTHHNIAVWSN